MSCAFFIGGCDSIIGIKSLETDSIVSEESVRPGMIFKQEKKLQINSDADDQDEGGNENPIVIRPIYPLLSPEYALVDGTYIISLSDSNSIKGNEISVTVYDLGRYQEALIESVREGDKIEIFGESVSVGSVRKMPDSELILINGGIENGGISLRKYHTLYQLCDKTGSPLFHEVGEIKIPMSDTFSLSVQSMKKGTDLIVYGSDDFISAINNHSYDFSYLNTKMTVINGHVEKIIYKS